MKKHNRKGATDKLIIDEARRSLAQNKEMLRVLKEAIMQGIKKCKRNIYITPINIPLLAYSRLLML